MELRVSDLFKMEVLSGAKAIAGREGLDHLINGVTIIDAPDIADWLKGNELLLTSLYSIHSFNQQDQREFIRQLALRGVSALAVKLNKYVEEIPLAMIEAGDEFCIPIIEFPRAIPFVDIMYPVMAELFNRQVKKLEYYKEVHDRFTILALADEGLETIALSLEKLIGNPVSIFDKNFKCLASTDDSVIDFETLGKEDAIFKDMDRKFPLYCQTVNFTDRNDGQSSVQVVVPIETINNIKAYLIITKINRQLEELDYIAVESAATIICLALVKQFSVAEVERKFRNDLIDDLVMGKINSLSTIQQRASLIGLDLDRSYVIVLLNVNNIQKLYKKTEKQRQESFTKFEHEIYTLLHEIISFFSAQTIIRSSSNQVMILLAVNEKNKEKIVEEAKEFVEKVQQKMQQKMNTIYLAAGIGNIAKTVKDIPRSYKEAQDALDFGKRIGGEAAVTAFSELGILRLLCQYPDVAMLKKFIPDPLNILIEHDQSYKNDLLKTLETFLMCNRNATKTAQTLFIHYKTLLYRLDRIKEIANLNFENSEEILNMQIGLKILKVLDK